MDTGDWEVIPDYGYAVLYAYETGYDEGDATLFVSCYEFLDPPELGFFISWDTFISIFDDIPVYLGWDGGDTERQAQGWNAGSDGDSISPPSRPRSIVEDFLEVLATSDHLEINAHGYQTIVNAKFDTSGYEAAIAPIKTGCK